MAQGANANNGRALALARRKALSNGGKAALKGAVQREVAPAKPSAPAPEAKRPVNRRRPVAAAPVAANSSREASLARRKALSTKGKTAVQSKDRVRTNADRVQPPAKREQTSAGTAKSGDCGCGCGGKTETSTAVKANKAPSRTVRSRKKRIPAAQISLGKAASLARRKAMSSRGKAGVSNAGMSEAQTARAANPQLTGRELAKTLREQRSRRGSSGQKKSAPSGRRRKAADNKPGPAQDAPWKVGASETGKGQTLTGTMVGRDKAVTGDEASTCRDITGTEYLGADIFREFCNTDPAAKPQRGGQSATARGNSVTGNKVGRSTKVTGDESGTCKNVTGSEYVGAEQTEAFCGTRPEPTPNRVTGWETRKGKTVTGNDVARKATVTGGEAGMGRKLTGTQYTNVSEAEGPAKVGHSKTLRGGSVSGTLVGRRQGMTGDEAGSCRNVTGDDYIGEEQFISFCNTKPEPKDRKVGVSQTFAGKQVSGTMTGRSKHVTGDEPGTCKTITGTPYAGTELYKNHCEAEDYFGADARMRPNRRSFGAPMSGLQPSVGGKMTGDEKGACENVSGTPYVGEDQVAGACPAQPAEPGSADYPQSLAVAAQSDFSIDSPAHAAQEPAQQSRVTGAQCDNGLITGPFGMAGGKVTGTEEARFGAKKSVAAPVAKEAQEIDGRIKSRIR